MDRLCVYCGSRSGHDPSFGAEAAAFGRELVERNVDLVYGGGGVGLMGVLAESVLDAGGDVIGVIPADLTERERLPDGLSEVRVVESMHERKRTMFDLASGFVALAGGLGTLDELFEMLTWAQLDIHDYPCGLLNVNGYYDELLAFLDTAVAAGFVADDHRELVRVHDDAGTLLEEFETAAASAVGGDTDRPDP